MSDGSIRPATPADLDGVVACVTALFVQDSGTRDPLRNQGWPAAHAAEWCAGMIAAPSALVLVATDGEDVVGHLIGDLMPASDMWTGARAELVSMYVDPASRGAGVGGRLVDAFVAWAKDGGAARLTVTAYAENEAALALYRKHGFAPLSIISTVDL
ncbi:GNAT family N-acetyltransferase [Kribbella sp. NPDC051952]|uniref:GNAT family N-acetyltransferase n=1 Tax=Kribbella sp. NPDC051952 TaxID=3154851 RepID=UPI0034356CBA